MGVYSNQLSKLHPIQLKKIYNQNRQKYADGDIVYYITKCSFPPIASKKVEQMLMQLCWLYRKIRCAW